MIDRSMDAACMRKAISLARQTWPSPNPRVGAVVAREGVVVGRGKHVRAGCDHAEVVALSDAGEAARGATLYVTLEPCCHYGRTPPCTQAIIEAGVSRVVFGCPDPNPRVSGGGVEALMQAGIPAEQGPMREVCERLVAGHAKYVRVGLPYVTWKYAMTLDGKIATHTGQARWITGARSRAQVHRMRRASDAVITGIGTVLADDPRLTARPGRACGGAYRVVFDSRARLPLGSAILAVKQGPVVVVATDAAPMDRVRTLEAAGAHVLVTPGNRATLPLALESLASVFDVREALLECGPALAASFLQEGLIDELVAFVSGKLFGGLAAPGPLGGTGVEILAHAPSARITRVRRFGEDVAISAVLPPGGEGG